MQNFSTSGKLIFKVEKRHLTFRKRGPKRENIRAKNCRMKMSKKVNKLSKTGFGPAGLRDDKEVG